MFSSVWISLFLEVRIFSALTQNSGSWNKFSLQVIHAALATFIFLLGFVSSLILISPDCALPFRSWINTLGSPQENLALI